MGKKTRLLFIVPRFGTIHRGVEAFAFELISRLDRERFDVGVLSGAHQLDIPGVAFHRFPLLSREMLRRIDSLPRLVRRLLGRFCLGSSAEIEALSLACSVGRSFSERFDLAIPCGGYWTYRLARRLAPQTLGIGHSGAVARDLAQCDAFVALTPFDAGRANAMRPSLRTVVIPNGVDFQRFGLVPPHGRPMRTILCVGALVQDKRHDLLFDAVSLLPDDVRVICAGVGPLREALARHPLAVAGRVKFRAVPYAQVHKLYLDADVFSLASPDEAFGIVFLEAMASGLPVVAHDGPRQRFVVSDLGLLCNVYDRETYASALAEALKVGIRLDVRLAAERKYSWTRIVAEYSALFETIRIENEERLQGT